MSQEEEPPTLLRVWWEGLWALSHQVFRTSFPPQLLCSAEAHLFSPGHPGLRSGEILNSIPPSRFSASQHSLAERTPPSSGNTLPPRFQTHLTLRGSQTLPSVCRWSSLPGRATSGENLHQPSSDSTPSAPGPTKRETRVPTPNHGRPRGSESRLTGTLSDGSAVGDRIRTVNLNTIFDPASGSPGELLNTLLESYVHWPGKEQGTDIF